MALRGEALHHAFAVLLPIFAPLYARDDRGGGADAVPCGVPPHHLLAFLGCRSSLAHVQTSFVDRMYHAAPPLARTRSIASSPARSQPLRATRKAAGSLARPAARIRSSHTSWAERFTASFSVVESSA